MTTTDDTRASVRGEPGAVLCPCLCGKGWAPHGDHGEGCPSRHLRLVGYRTANGDPTIWTGTSSFAPGRDTPVFEVVFDDRPANARSPE